jgi:protein TonB
MTVSQILLKPVMLPLRTSFSLRPEPSPLRERSVVVGLVVLLHLSLFAAYLFQPEQPAVLVNEMSVSFANMQMQQADVVPQPKPKAKQPEVKPDPLAEQPAATEEVAPAPQAATPPSPVVLDAEPDYRADYLNNPRPPYPMAARRMGYHGKVVLNVEVLAEGKAGEVKLQQSSGYEMLDNAALQTVKTWRFTPARRLGQPVTQWFLVPIKFSLEGNEA